MAEDLGYSKTEAPTPRRREEARQQGQVALSPEFTGGVLLLTGVLALWLGGPGLGGGLLGAMQQALAGMGRHGVDPGDFQGQTARFLLVGLGLIGSFVAATFVVGLAASAVQVGFHVSAETLLPRWSKLSPSEGWGRLFSSAAAMQGLTSVLKLAAVILLAWWVVRGRAAEIASLAEGSLSGAAAQGWAIAMRLALAIAAALVVVGLVDYSYRRLRHENSLRMSRQELKEELKREEGDPMMRARIRKLGRELARKRMMDDVPRATVVITNPTHLAIAIRYERGVMPAPRVVAKGAGYVADRIVSLARRHAVPVIERKPVARALFKAVKVGQEIPIALYHAVAEVLAYVYRLRGAA